MNFDITENDGTLRALTALALILAYALGIGGAVAALSSRANAAIGLLFPAVIFGLFAIALSSARKSASTGGER